MIRACVFDLDGTLLDTEVLWVEATAAYLRDAGEPVDDLLILDIVYGRSWRDVFDSLTDAYPHLGLDLPAMETAIRPFFNALRDSRDVRIASSVDCLIRLAERLPVCIVSGSPRSDLDAAVKILGVESQLQFTLAADDYGPGKPDPTCFRLAAERLGVDPSACVVFEDSLAGVTAAKAAGMRCVGLARPGAPVQDLSAADLILGDLASFDVEMLR